MKKTDADEVKDEFEDWKKIWAEEDREREKWKALTGMNIEEDFTLDKSGNIIPAIESIEIKGVERARKIITAEELFQAYFNLIDFKQFIIVEGLRRERQPSVFLNGMLGKLNVEHDILTGEVIEENRREKGEIEGIINSLFETEDQVMSFFFKKEENGEIVPVKRDDYKNDEYGNHKIATLKEWLEFVRERIMNYLPNSNPKVEQYLKCAKEELIEIQPLDISTEKKRKYCSTQEVEEHPSELERTKRIFEVVKRLIGHTSFRYILTHNIRFYGKPNNVSIDIIDLTNNSSIEDVKISCEQFSFYPSNDPSDGKRIDKISEEKISKNIFSLYFLDSIIYLPIEGDVRDQSLNAIFLGFVPLSFLEPNMEIPVEDLVHKIPDYFKKVYQKYLKRKYGIPKRDI